MTSSLAEPPTRVTEDHLPSLRTGNRPPNDGSIERVRLNEQQVNEASPLLTPVSNEDDGLFEGHAAHEESASDLEESADDFPASTSVWYLMLLTVSIGGLQIAWSVELSNGSPYLLELGLSKSLMALVWIAGPLSGTLVQPYVGMLSDNCRVPWGKRKPFMLGGTLATIASLLCLAWSREIVGGLSGFFGADLESNGVKYATLSFAVAWVYILDFAINTVQAAIRAFIVDCAPPQQQEAANAMASRMTGAGNIIGYIAGYINLPQTLWFLGNSQFKDLCAIASIALSATILLSCLTVNERDPRLEGPPSKDAPGVTGFFYKIFTSIRRLPPQTAKVCAVQLCAWVGFFPMLFYTSSYISEIYVEPFLEEKPDMTPQELDLLYENGTRVGTFALLVFAIVSLATNVFLPFVIAPTFDSVPIDAKQMDKDYEAHPKSWTDHLIIPGFTLRRAWIMSQLLFMVCMFCTVFVRTVEAATALIGLVGITWALTLWAPWAIISAEIAHRDDKARRQRQERADDDHHDAVDGEETTDKGTDQAGVILGIHNMAIAAPQIIATVVSSIIFNVFQKPRGTPGDHSISIVLALGGIMVGASVFFIHRINDDSITSDDCDTYSDVEQADSDDVSAVDVRNKSYEQLPRASLQRALLTRQRSYGGAEY